MQHEENIKRLRKISWLLDSKFEGPAGIRFGLDGIIGLIPVVGDFITTALSVYIIAQAAVMGVGTSTLLRMAVNVAIENVIDAVPILGSLFDFYWKSNNMNMALIETHLVHPEKVETKSKIILGFICLGLVALLSLTAYATFKLLSFIINLLLQVLN